MISCLEKIVFQRNKSDGCISTRRFFNVTWAKMQQRYNYYDYIWSV